MQSLDTSSHGLRPPRSVLRWLIPAVLLGSSASPARAQAGLPPPVAPPAAAPRFLNFSPPDPAGPRRVAVVTSGAISLGAYEAGVNWALLWYLREQRRTATRPTPRALPDALPMLLTTATGASAGNINALLSIASYCADASAEPYDNLFHSTWMPIGITELIHGHLPEDGLLARARIRETADAVLKGLSRPEFEPCEVPMGITLTALDPKRVAFGDLGIEHLRNSVLMRAVVAADHTLQLQPLVPKQATGCASGSACELESRLYRAAIGESLRLPYDRTSLALDGDSVKSAIEASAAVQFVFGAKGVLVCRDDGAPGYPCAGGGTERTELFTDGGFFDNTPLGLAIALGATRADGSSTDEYIYIDPSREAPALQRSSSARCAPHEHPHSFSRLGGLLSSLLGGARSYELATVARYFEGEGVRIRSTVRHHRVIGSHLGHFAAFTSRVFREYDYDAGLADGLFFVAERVCAGTDGWSPLGSVTADCVRSTLADLALRTGITAAGERGGLVVRLLNRTLKMHGLQPIAIECLEEPAADSVLVAVDDALQAAGDPNGAPPGAGPTLMDMLLSYDRFGSILEHLEDHGIEDKLERCDDPRFCTEAERELLTALTNDAGSELRSWVATVLARQRAIEEGHASSAYAEGSPALVELAQDALHQEALIAGFRAWNGGSDAHALALLPYSVGMEAVRGGLDVSYRLHLPLLAPRWLGFVGQAGLWLRKPQTTAAGWGSNVHVDGLLSLKTSRRGLLWPTFEVGAQLRRALDQDEPVRVGGELGASFIAEKLRVSFVQYTDRSALFIGIGDFPGLLRLIL